MVNGRAAAGRIWDAHGAVDPVTESIQRRWRHTVAATGHILGQPKHLNILRFRLSVRVRLVANAGRCGMLVDSVEPAVVVASPIDATLSSDPPELRRPRPFGKKGLRTAERYQRTAGWWSSQVMTAPSHGAGRRFKSALTHYITVTSRIHREAQRYFGRDLPCQVDGPCRYMEKREFDPETYDVLIGHM